MIYMIKPFIFAATSVTSSQRDKAVLLVNTSLFNSDLKDLETHWSLLFLIFFF